VRPPGPRGLPFVGDVAAFERDRIGWLVATRQKYGDVVRIGPRTFVAHDADAVREILSHTGKDYLLDTSSIADSRERHRLQEAKTDWMAVRTGIWRLTNGPATAEVGATIDRFLKEYGGKPDACARVTGRTVTSLCVGDDADVAGKGQRAFEEALDLLDSYEGRLRWMRRDKAEKARQTNGSLLDDIDNVIKERQISYDEVSPETLPMVLRMLVFASNGVLGVAMTWALQMLAEHPDKLEDVPAFLKECQRLYPPQWLLTRTTLRNVTIGGYDIPKNSEVVVCPYLLHRDERYWRNPDTFDPTRWLDDQVPHAPHAYVPFGSGPRVCPGLALGNKILHHIVERIAASYEVTAATRTGLDTGSLLRPLPGGVRWTST
jgi:unspecific monooxygenase